MTTLKGIFDIFYTITKVSIDARDSSGKLLHTWKFGDDITVTNHMQYDINDGILTVENVRINHHGERTRGGAEIGWGVITKVFPPQLLEAEVTHMTASERGTWKGHSLLVDVEMHPATVEMMLL